MKLSCVMAIIKVRKSGEVDVAEKKDQYDVLNDTCAAVEEDILAGDGVASMKASLALSTNSPWTSNIPPTQMPNPCAWRTSIKTWG